MNTLTGCALVRRRAAAKIAIEFAVDPAHAAMEAHKWGYRPYDDAAIADTFGEEAAKAWHQARDAAKRFMRLATGEAASRGDEMAGLEAGPSAQSR